MALEAVVFQQNTLGLTTNKNLYNMLGGSSSKWSYDSLISLDHDDQDQSGGNSFACPYYDDNTGAEWNPLPTSIVPPFEELQLSNVPSPEGTINSSITSSPLEFQHFDGTVANFRTKRRRTRRRKDKEDVENQRMTHIAVERNRRKQMNEYLSALRSLMPESYVQRGDQASIIGGAINFVKELEQKVQLFGVGKEMINSENSDNTVAIPDRSMPFSEYFTFPQYSDSVADVEVMLVDSHANLKIRSKRRPKQLLKLVSGLQAMNLTVLHLNVTSQEEFVLYSLSVKVEEECNLTSVDEIATAAYQILVENQDEDFMFCLN